MTALPPVPDTTEGEIAGVLGETFRSARQMLGNLPATVYALDVVEEMVAALAPVIAAAIAGIEARARAAERERIAAGIEAWTPMSRAYPGYTAGMREAARIARGDKS
jgi:hypothetical protein